MLSDAQITQLIREFVDNKLQWTGDVRLTRKRLDPFILKWEKRLFSDNRQTIKDALSLSDIKIIESEVDSLLKQKDISLKKDSVQYKKLSLEMLKGLIAVYSTELERMDGNYENPYDKFLETSLKQKLSGILLSSLIKEFTANKIASAAWTDKNKAEMVTFYNQLVKIMGDKDIATYLPDDFSTYVSILKKFPWNATKMKGVKNKSLLEIIALIKENSVTWKTLDSTTVRNRLVRVNALFDYAKRKHYITINHAEEFKEKKKPKSVKKRLQYTTEDLNKWFSSPVYTKYAAERIRKKPEKFWVPLIMLFSGLRTGEVCQLYKQDIITVEGIPCFDINNELDKRVKTPESIRKVPIHPFLIKLGFLKYVHSVTHERLWSNLKNGRDGYAYLFNKWADGYNRDYVTDNPKKVPYSFRHTFTNFLKQYPVSKEIVDEITGHVVDGLAFTDYSEKYRVKLKYDAVRKAKYNIDISHIKYPF